MILLFICVALLVCGVIAFFCGATNAAIALALPMILYVVGLVLFWLFMYDPNEELDE